MNETNDYLVAFNEAAAKVRLMDAAPNMLVALRLAQRRLLEYDTAFPDFSESPQSYLATVRVDEAIAKVEGR